MNRIYIVLKEDIIDFPPVLSIIRTLVLLDYKVIHVGVYSDAKAKEELKKLGVRFYTTSKYNGKGSILNKFKQQLEFRRKVSTFLKEEALDEHDKLWLIQSETIVLLYKLVEKYHTILHYFEYVDNKISWKYKLISPKFNLNKTLKLADKIVACEYNRAQIMKGMFQLDELPVVLPNKMVIDESSLNIIPDDLKVLINDINRKVKDKKVILYQGIFLDGERRLEEFCEAINLMSDDYVLIAMGRGSEVYESLKKKYESNKILFIPFIRPPYHLLITKLATIGVLSYFARPTNFASVINPLYCAPNKVFEYSKFGIPMISNDIPGLYYLYLEYKCGECIPYPMNTTQINNVVNSILANYDDYSKGAKKYYNSVNMVEQVRKVLQ